MFCSIYISTITSRCVWWVTYRPVRPGAYHLLFCYMCVYLKIVNAQVTIIKTYLLTYLLIYLL